MAVKAKKKSEGRPPFAEVGKPLGKRYDLYLAGDLAAHVDAQATDTPMIYIRELVRADFLRSKKKNGK